MRYIPSNRTVKGSLACHKALNPLNNYRRYCICTVFVPYFINVKRLPRLETFNRTMSWLDICNIVERLDFDAKGRINYALDHVGTFYPTYQDRLEQANKPFYELLKKEGVIC